MDGFVTMRVLLLCPGMHPRDGGPPRTVSGSALALARAGVAVEIATIGHPKEDAETRERWSELHAAGVPIHIFPRDVPRVIGRSGALKRFLRNEAHRFDLLHVHCIWETALADGAAIFRHRGKPTLVSTHGMLDRWQMRRSALKKALAMRFLGTGAMLHRADAVLYGTDEEAGEAEPLALASPVVIMPNGVEPWSASAHEGAGDGLLARFPNMRDWKRTVLFFSRLHPKKGVDLLVEAFGRVHSRFPDAGLLIAAIAQDEIYGDAIRARIAEIGTPNIILVSEPEGLKAEEAFAVADIFCLPSHQEGFSQAILEAASACLPELITDKCHIPEIEQCGAGLVVPDTVDGIERGLRTLLEMDDAALSAMGRKGRQLVAENYTWDRVAQRLIGVYRDAVAARATGSAKT